MPRALVTGSVGFIGRNIIPRLKHAGYTVDETEDFEAFYLRAIDLEFTYDVVLHLAANIVNVDQRARMGMAAYDDISLDLLMCRYLEHHPPTKRFVVMSSCAVDYPNDPYCIVKRTLEAFAKTLAKQGVPVTVLRPFSGYGPDQSGEYPFRAIVDRALRREDPLIVWSNSVRDWLYITDLCDAIMWAIDGGFAKATSPVEIGTGVGHNFIDLAQRIGTEVGYMPRIHVATDKIGSSEWRVARPELAQSYGFKAKVPLDEGIKRVVAQLRGAVTLTR